MINKVTKNLTNIIAIKFFFTIIHSKYNLADLMKLVDHKNCNKKSPNMSLCDRKERNWEWYTVKSTKPSNDGPLDI